MASKKLIIGNWKMNPTYLREAKDLVAKVRKETLKLKKSEVVFCPSAAFLGLLAADKKGKVVWGAQDVAAEWEGAATGSVSAAMLGSVGATYVIIGHSERRAAGDTDELINKKVKMALRAGLKVVLCVGETQRDEHGEYLSTVQRQLEGALEGIAKPALKNLVIAYEPVWAIGKNATGVDTPEAFHHNAIFVKKVLSSKKGVAGVPVIYGGSVNVKNAMSFITAGQAEGLLIGRESLNPKNFVSIIKQVEAL